MLKSCRFDLLFCSTMVMVFLLFFLFKVSFSGYSCVSFEKFLGLENNIIVLFSSLSVVLVCLTFWVSGLMLLVSYKYEYSMFYNYSVDSFKLLLFFLLLVISLFFLTNSLFVFYVCFELSLIPTMLLIIKWGYQPERLQATFYFIMYTVCASLPLLVMILKVSGSLFSSSLLVSMPLYSIDNGFCGQLGYVCFVLAFLVKVPMWGVHLWLPKAHVEAPVSGSMILAGVLLKLGGYGLIKVMLMIYKISFNVINFFYSVSLWGALVVGLVCLSSVDMKSLIAYSSVVHMNMMVLGVVGGSSLGVLGAVSMMLAHGVSSPGMFAMASYNYEKSYSRNILLQKGIGSLQPSLMVMWFLLVVANMAGPPSLNLVSELLICVGVLKVMFYFFFILGGITFIGGAYNLYLYSSQQGNSGLFMFPTGINVSVDLLVGFLHCVPIYSFIFLLFILV